MTDATDTTPGGGGGAKRTSAPELAPTGQRVIWALVALLLAKRIAYHLAYIVADPFALATFADGRRYELAARDLLAHPPLGTLPFDVQGLYAYMLALPMAAAREVVVGLVLQLVIAAVALFLFQRAARAVLGPVFGGLALCVLLASPELAFYENKYLPVSLGVATAIGALAASVRAFERLEPRRLALAGFAWGLAVLGAPALLLAIPAALLAFAVLARGAGRAARAVLGPFALGLALALAPMAARNQLVTGAPEIVSSRELALGLVVGNNAFADGRWNTAGGLIGGGLLEPSAGAFEGDALAGKLGVSAEAPEALGRAIDRALFARALDYIASHPRRTLELWGDKLWLALGNQRFSRHYDLAGENEKIGAYHQWGLPFGAVLALGALGFLALLRRARAIRAERARLIALGLVLGGQAGALLAWNVVLYSSGEGRVALLVPLAFASGAALEALYAALRARKAAWASALPRLPVRFELRPLMVAVAVALGAQAFWPRQAASGRPSAAYYFNLGVVEERLGRFEEAARSYGEARALNPRQAAFYLAQGRVLRRLGRFEESMALLTHIIRMPNTPASIHAQAHAERMLVAAQVTGTPDSFQLGPSDL